MKKLNVVLFAAVCLTLLVAWSVGSDQPATFPGGSAAMQNYLRDSLRYPDAEMKAGREEVVQVSFDVSAEGVVQNPQTRALIGGAPAFQEEAKRLILSMPGWSPELNKRGKPVASREYTLVQFRLSDSLREKYPLAPDSSVNIPAIGEVMPRFQADEAGFQNYLMWTIRYPQLEREQGLDGTVYIYFEVNPSGSISNVRAVKGVPGAPGLAKEAIRVVSEMPRWIPGYKDGKPVKVGMTVPVRFSLQ